MTLRQVRGAMFRQCYLIGSIHEAKRWCSDDSKARYCSVASAKQFAPDVETWLRRRQTSQLCETYILPASCEFLLARALYFFRVVWWLGRKASSAGLREAHVVGRSAR